MPDITETVEDDDDEGEDDDEEGLGETDAGVVKQAMFQMVQGRLAELIGKSSGYIESLPVEVKRTVEALKGVQVDYEKLQTEFKRELLQLEEKVRVFLFLMLIIIIMSVVTDYGDLDSISGNTNLFSIDVPILSVGRLSLLPLRSQLERKSLSRTMKNTRSSQLIRMPRPPFLNSGLLLSEIILESPI